MVALFDLELVALSASASVGAISLLFLWCYSVDTGKEEGTWLHLPAVRHFFGNLKCLDLNFLSYLAVDGYLGEAPRF